MDRSPSIPLSLKDPSRLFFQADTTRRSIILAYWLIIILALPLWWHTTSIERLSLPSSRVVSQVQNHLRFPIIIHLATNSSGISLAGRLQTSINERLETMPDRCRGFDISVSDAQRIGTAVSDRIYTVVSGEGNAVVRNRQLELPLSESTLSTVADVLSALLIPFPTTSKQKHRVAQYSPRYRLAFTLLNEDVTAGSSVTHWDVSEAITRHISPILNRLSVLHNFTIESQIQFHAPLAFEPCPLGDAYGLTPEDLTVFVNSAQWTLSSSVSNDPVLHFILFVPSASRRPLYILHPDDTTSSSNAFLLPQWGGIVLINPPEQLGSSHLELKSTSLDPVFSAFSNQLLALLGVPHMPANIYSADEDTITEWQLDALLRRRAMENAQGSKDTLQSIVKLVAQIENMPVGQDVKGDVQDALLALEKAYAGPDSSLTVILVHTAHALTLASRAFFNPGMLALLYFPAEHKYAVYTPLFASAVIPLFVAAMREFLAWRGQQREQNRG